MGLFDRKKKEQTPEEKASVLKKAVAKLEVDAVVGRAEVVVRAAGRKKAQDRTRGSEDYRGQTQGH